MGIKPMLTIPETAWIAIEWTGQRILPVVVVFYLLRNVAEFSLSQSLTLAALLSVIVYVARLPYLGLKAAGDQEQNFRPFYLKVAPKWNEFLLDFKLVKDDEEFTELLRTASAGTEEDESTSAPQFNVLQECMMFTFLKSKPLNLQSALIYYNNYSCFLSKIKIEEIISGIKIGKGLDDVYIGKGSLPPDTGAWTFPLRNPAVYIKHGAGCFELGLELPENWWEWVCKVNPELGKYKSDIDHLTGSVTVMVATLPYDEFCWYWDIGEYSLEDTTRINEHRINALAESGWKRMKPPDLEVPVDFPEWIEHKYFTVEHREI